jgi:hypothetical protein
MYRMGASPTVPRSLRWRLDEEFFEVVVGVLCRLDFGIQSMVRRCFIPEQLDGWSFA